MSTTPEPTRDFVLVGGKCYPADLFHAALHSAVLGRLEKIPEGSSVRRVAMAVRNLKTKGAHKAVMREALRMLMESGGDIPLAQAIQEGGGVPIAAFPLQDFA